MSIKIADYSISLYRLSIIIFVRCQHLNNLQNIVEHINPLWTKFLFRRFSGHLTKIGSFRLPTHRRDAHTNFFYDPFLK